MKSVNVPASGRRDDRFDSLAYLVPQKTDIFLTHGPAFGHLDVAHPKQKGNLVSETLARRIEELKISYVICGHIHGGYGSRKTRDATYSTVRSSTKIIS